MKINNVELEVINADITDMEVDAIVCPANDKLVMGAGLALNIKGKGGQGIEDEVIKKRPIKVGGAVVTGAGKLSARYIIHAATMGHGAKTSEVVIRNACKNSLEFAKGLKVQTIAFPALGCGMGGFPAKAAAKIMAQEIFKHVKYEEPTLKKIILVLYDIPIFNVFQKQVISYLEHIENKLCRGPFITVDIIIEINGGIVLIERSNPPFGWAVPGGFVDYGETLEECAVREAKEETDLDICFLKQMHTYSDPKRDPRFHTITTVFVAKADGMPTAGDDAKNVKIILLEDIPNIKLAFDHSDVLEDYKNFKQGQ
ncbi:macro domain-containing protein [Thermoproteota archaeon]